MIIHTAVKQHWSTCWKLTCSKPQQSVTKREPRVVMKHDDVIKWKHFPRYWPFVRGIHRSPVNSPHKGQWRGALMFCLICVWINDWVNNREAGDLRRHLEHYDVSVMVNFVVIGRVGCCDNNSLRCCKWRQSRYPDISQWSILDLVTPVGIGGVDRQGFIMAGIYTKPLLETTIMKYVLYTLLNAFHSKSSVQSRPFYVWCRNNFGEYQNMYVLFHSNTRKNIN